MNSINIGTSLAKFVDLSRLVNIDAHLQHP